ncbi:MAG TPA: hypothetical protein VLZ81_03525, partial [Blastocatellia bacterium]|nr:hypothetical protein [Blastocatellia bacterium]
MKKEQPSANKSRSLRAVNRLSAALRCVAILATALGILFPVVTWRHYIAVEAINVFGQHTVDGMHRKPDPDSPDLAMAWRRLSLLDENGEIPAGALVNAIQQREDNAAYVRTQAQAPDAAIAGISPSSWVSRGPQNVGARTRALVIHPTNPSILWAACVSGGVWKSTNAGATWAPTDDFMLNLAANCLTIDPSNPNVLYCGTGEGYFNADALQGAGIFKTTDGGTTWAQLASTANWTTDGSGRDYVNRIAIARTNSNLILAATTFGGIQRSTDGGVTWTTTFAADASYEVAFAPGDDTKAVAHIMGIDTNNYHSALYSTDGGATWQQSSLSHVVGFDSRIELAYAPSNRNIVYASLNTNLGLTCGLPSCAGTSGLWRSTDGGQTYSRMGTTGDSGASWYANPLWVSPTDSNFIVTGGGNLYKSTNGGVALQVIGAGYLLTQQPHPDVHFVVSDPGFDGVTNKRVYVCTDGGVFRTDDITTAAACETCGWVSLNAAYQTTQYYGAAGNGLTGLVVGGAQDNGTLASPSSSQTAGLMFGGDGGFCAVDPTDDTYCYGEYIDLEITRSQDHGQSSSYIYGGIADAGVNANFIAPFVLDPNNPNVMLAGGASLWRSSNVKTGNPPSWSATRSPGTTTISAIAVAKGNSNIIWVAQNDGKVYKTDNGTAATPTWTTVDDNGPVNPLPNRYPNR